MSEQKPILGAEFYQQILEDNKDAVKEAVKQKIFKGVNRELTWDLPDAVKKTVSAFIEEEIAPEIKRQLMESKDEIVEAATVMVREISVEIGKAIQKKAAENLTKSWQLDRLVKAILG